MSTNNNNIYNIHTHAHACASDALEFFLPCIPPKATAQQKGAFVCRGKIRFFTKATVRASENVLASLLLPYVPKEPFTSPVSLSAEWVFPWRKTERKRIVSAGVNIPHAVRPDLDNLEKSLLDVLTRLNFWADDSLVTDKHTRKFFGSRPGIKIRIAKI